METVGDGSSEACGWKQRALDVVTAVPCRGVVVAETVLINGPAAEAAPDAVDDLGLVVVLDHQDGAAGSAAPAHLAELVGVPGQGGTQDWRASLSSPRCGTGWRRGRP